MIICNTSPITNLAAIGALDLLQKVYGTIHIPEAVFYEIVYKDGGSAGATEVQNYSWIIKEKITNHKIYKLLYSMLDEGEAEVLTLALERNATGVLLDENNARLIAKQMSIPHVGLLGVLLEAKNQGHILEIKSYLDRLISNNFWLSKKVYLLALEKAGEKP